jgi:hypothetical protein
VLRRGFKAEAEQRAVAVRRELGLRPTDPLSAEQLATHLRVGYRSAEDLVPMAALEELDRIQPGCFSACTLPGPNGPVVVVNPLDSPARRLSDAMHELSHLILRHETRRLERIAGLTFLTCDPIQEEEANHLAGALLLPRPLLVAAVARGMNAQAIADECGVSEQMARWRLNATGVALQQHRRQTG